MMKLGIRLREDTFNTLMTAALENDNTEVVPSMFNQLLSLNLRPDSLSYTALITALARLSRPEAAVSPPNFFKNLEQKRPNYLDSSSLHASEYSSAGVKF